MSNVIQMNTENDYTNIQVIETSDFQDLNTDFAMTSLDLSTKLHVPHWDVKGAFEKLLVEFDLNISQYVGTYLDEDEKLEVYYSIPKEMIFTIVSKLQGSEGLDTLIEAWGNYDTSIFCDKDLTVHEETAAFNEMIVEAMLEDVETRMESEDE